MKSSLSLQKFQERRHPMLWDQLSRKKGNILPSKIHTDAQKRPCPAYIERGGLRRGLNLKDMNFPRMLSLLPFNVGLRSSHWGLRKETDSQVKTSQNLVWDILYISETTYAT
ncbi:hypothetical protein AVEN_168478-1 [Araneus ventricosus]|uniref:Uncharacterized protein n=1 Tax=Araneus ventricosus TaxID=182803 RepID=A0A4Y2M721_ARAVE|nr:hypothetical protein AVEN_8183-1 [Araneus ventricosus]GBN22569.1 hypothetical protein AVEN_252203-1 [Araneus ventricosus]GBN22645.1 hypothetical protein AVEN_134739-1 [Araneus ventricosus]GBN22660.1 hypothetical protein AVEN_168478-1 [Araneus ventricosus]